MAPSIRRRLQPALVRASRGALASIRPGRATELVCSAAMGFSADTLRDRVAIVTGASQGIGRAIAVELARVGAHVVVCSRRPDAIEAVAEAVRAESRRALALACDVGEPRQVDAVVART